MKQLGKTLLVLAFSIFTVYAAKAQDQGRKQITGGEEIDISTRPFQISLQLNGGHWCGGSILNDTWIITAAHCVAGLTADDLEVAVGITEQNDAGISGQLIDVEDIFIHPDVNGVDNDIALLQLTTPITYGGDAQPIRLINADNQDLNDAGQDAYASGWGWTTPGTSSGSNHLMGVEIPIITNQEADAQLDISSPGHSELTNNMIATGFEGTERLGPCHGDSGGPLTVTNGDGVIYLVGLVSWGVGGCVGGTNSPTVYVNAINYDGWVYGLICQDNVVISDPIHSDVLIESANSLEVSSAVDSDLIVDLRSGQQIILSDGFRYNALSDGMLNVSLGGNCESVTASSYLSFIELESENFLLEEATVNIYPNPTSRFITIEFSQTEGATSSFAIFDLQGKQVRSAVRHGLASDLAGEMEIDISDLQDGIYTYVFKSANGVIRGKVVKNGI